ncbi:MAG: restriction endonuclease [Armatimonadota bacterium]
MSKRRSDDAFTVLKNLFVVAPWWTCLCVAAAIYLMLSQVIPLSFGINPMLKEVGGVSRLFAPWAAGLILAMGLIAGLKRRSSGLLLAKQTGLDTIKDLSWREFEELVAAVFRKQGYGAIMTGSGADGGIDIVLSRGGEQTLVQCKHWRSSKVGVALIRELHGLTHSKMYQGSKGIFVTFGRYTSDAVVFAKENGVKLIDGRTLAEMIRSVQTKNQSTQPAESVNVPLSPYCPFCGRQMVIRTARRGNRAGSKFWGCTAYPSCRGTIDY